ncbi:TonB-dependent siderophore receptor (plasmid) [Sphingobium sp. V4]|uniref:TonB-dependent siderophore receptor n=1 Tax=Sphingobium sp. V4 TaxID=3038927 RepID=UPI0025580135|nr:TonB-dependent siderophore receptor [Sphingobium sp. V4]WIW90222.1 TonB-dependent siderophore receptor [Sphingobium sp. V4]
MTIYGMKSGLRTVLASTALVSMAMVANSGAAQAQGMAQNGTQQFDIPAQSLSSALMRFSRETRLELFYSADLAQGKTTLGVSGRMAPAEALSRLLAGTGLTFKFSNTTTITLEPAPQAAAGTIQLGPVRVEGGAASGAAADAAQIPTGPVRGYVASRSITAAKTDTPILEIPQSISVITADRMTDQGVQTINDALRYTAGVRTETNGAQLLDNNLYLRGFIQNSLYMYQDGLRGATPGYFGFFAGEPYGYERIEVLKGPGSVLYGQSEPGGLINMVSKRPTADPINEVQLTVGSFDHYQAAADLGGATRDGKLLYRIVGLVRDANTQVDYVKNDRVYIAPSLTWQPTDLTSFTVLASYQRNKGDFYAQVPATAVLLPNSNGHIPFSRFLGEPGWEGETTERYAIGYEFEHRLGDRVKISQNVRYTHLENDRQYLQALGALIDERQLNRRYTVRAISNDGVAADTRLQWDVDTGNLTHKITGGFDYLRGTSNWLEQTGNASRIDIFEPVYSGTVDTSVYTGLSLQDISADQLGLYVQDQIKYDRWVATVGIRQDWSWRKTRNVLTGTSVRQKDDAFTWRAGLTYVSDFGLAPYASYTESFTPIIGTDRLGNAFVPETGQQFEVGLKYQPTGSNSLLTLSMFDLRRQNVQTTDPENTSYSVQTGEVRVRGIEIEGVAEIAKGLNLVAAYTYNDAEVTESIYSAVAGNRPTRVPEHSASLWAKYKVQSGALKGLGIGSGVRYTGSTYGDDANTFKVPAFTLVDLALDYDFGPQWGMLDGLSASINVSNLFDKYYVPVCFTVNGCNYGTERTVLGSLRYRF